MNLDDRKQHGPDVRDDAQEIDVDLALKHFRESVHNWSEQEFVRPRSVQRSRWTAIFHLVANPVMACSLAGVLVIGSVGVPVSIRHERQVEAAKIAAQQRQQELEKQARDQQATVVMSDDELLSHVDSDIAQGAPDAMQPLASLMNDSGSSQ